MWHILPSLSVKAAPSGRIDHNGLKLWYDGYPTMSGKQMYNPCSVICSFKDNQLSDYWTNSAPYDKEAKKHTCKIEGLE